MPVEIRELVIRARVTPGNEEAADSTSPQARESSPPPEAIQGSVREVLRVLEDRKER